MKLWRGLCTVIVLGMIVIVMPMVKGNAMVNIKRTRPLELEVEWEAQADTSFRVGITPPMVVHPTENTLLFTEETFFREGFNDTRVVINANTSAEWKDSSGHSFGGLKQDTPYTIALYVGNSKLAAVIAMPLAKSSAPSNVRMCDIDETYPSPCYLVHPQHGEVRVSFEAPRYCGGDNCKLLRYLVEVSAGGAAEGEAESFNTWHHYSVVYEPHDLEDLSHVVAVAVGVGTSHYRGRVTAITDIGPGEASAVSANAIQAVTWMEADSRRRNLEKIENRKLEYAQIVRARAGATRAAEYVGPALQAQLL